MTCLHCGRAVIGESYAIETGLVHSTCRPAYDRHLRGLYFDCPKCGTTGKVNDSAGATKCETVPLGSGETPPCAWNGCMGCGSCRGGTRTIVVPVKITCALCDGVGWLKEKPTPVTRVVDWKR